MASVDKSEAVITFLQDCPTIADNPLFFNFGNIEDGASQVSVYAEDVALDQHFVDGSVRKRFILMLDKFKSVAYNSIVEGYTDENMDDYSTVQSVLEWINEQGQADNFPDFGTDCLVEEMKCQTNSPETTAVETSQNPPIAIYRITIQIEYIDLSTRLWK